MEFLTELREKAVVPGFPKAPYNRETIIDIYSKMIW
jgi:hypothetical protein